MSSRHSLRQRSNADAMTISGDGKLVLGEIRAKKALTAVSQSDAVQVGAPCFPIAPSP